MQNQMHRNFNDKGYQYMTKIRTLHSSNHKQKNNQAEGQDSLPVVVYSSKSKIRTPWFLFKSMLKDLLDSRELAWRLFIRDITAQYRQSILGILWAFVPPIMASAIFILLQSRGVLNVGETQIPYPVYVLVGTMLWQLFTESLNAPLKSVNTSKTMLAKINFPYEALITSAIYGVLFNLLIKITVIVVIFIYFDVSVSWSILLVTPALIMLMLFGIGVGLLLTPIGMLYNDVTVALPVLVQMWFFLTPVIYPTPDTFPLSIFTLINPVSPLLVGARDLMTLGFISDLTPYIIASCITIVILLVAWVIYHISKPILVERISA